MVELLFPICQSMCQSVPGDDNEPHIALGGCGLASLVGCVYDAVNVRHFGS